MIKLFNVLIIEDHPLIVNAYENALKHISKNNRKLEFDIDVASNCDSAYVKIMESSNTQKIDFIFLDIKLPASKDGTLISGEDLGIKIKKVLPKVKIIVATTYNDNYRINSIFKSINPEGFLIKNDLNPKELVLAIESIIENSPYYSKSVVQLMRKQVSNEIIIDDLDRKILYELSRGTKMSELPQIIPLSISGIEKRKRILKELFNLDKKDDRGLIKIAEEKGFI
ncbi:response regulator [Thalassobellus suaedae]|uniref:Response regulator n=1 Tax=Thalassobellus suaedae TaxID=3074124 RepID=A0ABY9Y719_9FLAO|nr:response regulator [Flavobacteriaceae bacterium HL-DH14]WNH14064.1 response regulator [Flavobacteriaceae bacterium HL-DH10]